MPELYEIFSTCYLWLWLSASLITVGYVRSFQFCAWRHFFQIMGQI